MSTSTSFRLRDGVRDLFRAPRAAWLVIPVGLAVCVVPLVLHASSASNHIAEAADGRVAFNLYAIWCAIAVSFGAIGARLAATTIASTMAVRPDPRPVPLAMVIGRFLAHGLPGLLSALFGVAAAALGLVVAAAAALPVVVGEELVRHASGAPSMIEGVLVSLIALAVFLAALAAAVWLAALTLPAGPASAVEQLAPSEALRRGAALARRAHLRLAAWTVGLFVVALAPLGIARLTVYQATGKKPPVAPILHAFQIHAAIVIAIAVISTLAQVAIYRRLRDTRP